jgi:hypothetical protein
MSSKSEEDIIIIVVLLLERKKDPDRERETARSDVQSVFTFTFNKASVFSIKRDDEIAFHPSSLPSFFCKIRVGHPKHFSACFFFSFFSFLQKFWSFWGWSLTALLDTKRARESPRERERREFLRKKRRRKKSNDRRGIDVVIECDVE